MKVALDLQLKGHAATANTSRTERKRETVLEVDGQGTVLKLKVEYLRSRELRKTNKSTTQKTAATEGKSYLITTEPGASVSVTYLNGRLPPAAETTAVRTDYRRFGERNEVSDAVAARALKPGERAPELELALEARFTERAEIAAVVERTEARFRGRKGNHGVFDLDLLVVVARGPFKLRVPLKGFFEVNVDNGRPLKMELSGPIVVEAQEGDQSSDASGQGRLTFAATRRYPSTDARD